MIYLANAYLICVLLALTICVIITRRNPSGEKLTRENIAFIAGMSLLWPVLAWKMIGMHFQRKFQCHFCGHVSENEEEVAQHIAICKKHPMQAEYKRLREMLESETGWANHYNEKAIEANEIAFSLQKKYNRLGQACTDLLEYRRKNTLNFQLEKADDFLAQLSSILNE